MSGTIREILTFRERKEMQEEKRIWQALRIADAEGFVRAFPDGIDTVLGEHGMGLSEGQMQRIAIARAIFAGIQSFCWMNQQAHWMKRRSGRFLRICRR